MVRHCSQRENSAHLGVKGLTEDLGKKKVFARFVPHQLNAPPYKTKKVNDF